MRSIKQLPKAVHSSLRSSVVLFDLTRVVEELIFNSIDAGATKINVAVSVGTCYVKVDDDGFGITRDGLVLVGEKYATSKVHSVAEMDATTESFGCRGEALSSLSDVSLLEIITKARGWPNGYRKIIKGCKSLYLGIYDKKQDFGTTVIVRELFYNQPVRRKCMHSSPKKVLHSVKKCVLRVALVHPQISFRVTDTENGDELLCTAPFVSPLPLVTSGFGADVSGSLRELNFSDGVFSLCGYLSAPLDTFSTKAVQYVYINSRFVCKGPIHKLLNNLSADSELLYMPRDVVGFQSWQRSRPQSYPAFILNLCCPHSSYDLTFEPSKTLVEFKDWVPVHLFVKQAISHFWREFPPRGDPQTCEIEVPGKEETWMEGNLVSPIEDIPVKSVVAKRKGRIQHNLSSICHSLSSGYPNTQSEESNLSLHQKSGQKRSRKLCGNTNVEEKQPASLRNHQNAHIFQDVPPTSMLSPEHYSFQRAPGSDPFRVKDNLFSELTVRQASEGNPNDDILGSKLVKDYDEADADMIRGRGSVEGKLEIGYFDSRNEVPSLSGFPKVLKKPFLRSCSLLGNVSPGSPQSTNHQQFRAQTDFRTKRKRLPSDDINIALDADEDDLFFNGLEENVAASSLSSSFSLNCQATTDLDVMPREFLGPHTCDRVDFDESNLLKGSVARVWKRGSNELSANSESYSLSSYSLFNTTPWNLERFSDDFSTEHNVGPCRSSSSTCFISGEGEDGFFSYGTSMDGFTEKLCPPSNTSLDYENFFSPVRSVRGTPHGFQSDEIICQNGITSKSLVNGADWLCLESSTIDNTIDCPVSEFHIPSPLNHNIDRYPRDKLVSQIYGQLHVRKVKSRRSHSAPPFYRGKCKFSTVYSCLTATGGEANSATDHNVATLPVTSEANHSSQPLDMKGVRTNEGLRRSQFQLHSADSVGGLIPNKMEDSKLSGIKWRNGNSQSTNGDKSQDLSEQNDILNLSSGLLHLAGGSMVPESISRDCLENAKVLQQLDKKFIPVVAGAILAVIDQHAADERIRLEELREKVLSGDGIKVTYLDHEQELVLPEIGYQLLQNYVEQIQNWGWICNIHLQGSGSFSKKLKLLHRQTSTIVLVAVPCILGVNLSDKDLFEFLEQLSETDGSSTMPPSVLRVLNFKACRGAIMFGDALLPSECSLIVEELKQTSLCFQCAHGRPTTVPLVNLEALHKQIAKLGLLRDGSDEVWHGLCRSRPTLERATQRLVSARGQRG